MPRPATLTPPQSLTSMSAARPKAVLAALVQAKTNTSTAAAARKVTADPRTTCVISNQCCLLPQYRNTNLVVRFKTKPSIVGLAARVDLVTAPPTARSLPIPPLLRRLPRPGIPVDPSSMPSVEPDSAVLEAISAVQAQTSVVLPIGARASGASAHKNVRSIEGIEGKGIIRAGHIKSLFYKALIPCVWHSEARAQITFFFLTLSKTSWSRDKNSIDFLSFFDFPFHLHGFVVFFNFNFNFLSVELVLRATNRSPYLNPAEDILFTAGYGSV